MNRGLVPAVLCAGLLGLVGGGAQTIVLHDVDSGLASPSGNYRWLDVADQEYSAFYRTNYNYTQATVLVNLAASPQPVHGVLYASGLKPNFSYQLKFVGSAGAAANERIGKIGRYWQEEWNGTGWVNGQNLNDKGDGHFPTPNDDTYFSRRDVPDTTSPTGLRYKYTCYWVAEYFVTDSNGNATVTFQADSSYHVLWKLSQRSPGTNDGVPTTTRFQASSTQPAYDVDYPERSVGIFGEWERLPTGALQLQPGDYACDMVLTEESFHGSGGEFAGGWATAMAGSVDFRVAPRLVATGVSPGGFSLEIADCYTGSTNDLQRCCSLGGTSVWQTICSFVSTDAKTNWMDTGGSPTGHAFYRLMSHGPPD